MALANPLSSCKLTTGLSPLPQVAGSSRVSFKDGRRPGCQQLQARRRQPRAGRSGRMGTFAIAAPEAPTKASSSGSVDVFDVSFRVHNTVTNPPLVIQLKDRDTGALSEALDIVSWETKVWDRSATGDLPGTYIIGKLPAGDVKNPGAALISYTGNEPKDKEEAAKQLARIYVTDVTLSAGGKDTVISAHSWCNAYHTEVYGPRIFFTAGALLPAETPKALVEDRQLDLAIIQGVDEVGKKIASQPRKPADRIEDYATYNDLGVYKKDPRPVLGDPSIDGFAYPRRIATNRPLNADGKTETPPKGDRWVPADDDFDETKVGSFDSSLKYAAIPLIVSQLTIAATRLGKIGWFAGIWGAIVAAVLALFSFGRNLTAGAASGVIGGFWNSYKELLTVYDETEDNQMIDNATLGTDTQTADQNDEETRKAVDALDTEERNILLRRVGIKMEDYEAPEKVVPAEKWKKLRGAVNNKLTWPEPLVYSGQHTPVQASDLVPAGGHIHRHDAWKTDEEFGRQFKAGANPFVLAACSELPANSAFKAKSSLIESFLEGNSLSNLIGDVKAGKAPRVFIVDYDAYLAEYAPKVNSQGQDRCLYAGRALFYERKDQRLVPVAFELYAPGTKEAAERVVYTPKDPPQVWQLAKAVFGAMDSGIHQLISHWLRTHACMEPFIIATDRTLSQLHPVYKFLQPHLQYTFRINADARSVLIAADKIVELVFTPGDQSMQLSATVYADWQFKDQAFPNDVVGRGLAKKGNDGKVDIISKDHPWAEDGKLIWEALETYVSGYLNCYYKDDQAVTSDPELTAWWDEIKNKGHPDAKADGWPPLNGIKDLTFILTTIAWVTSAHHAAVNFGQADYASFPLNRSSLLRKPIPAPGTKAYEALTDPGKFEKEFLRYLVNPLPASIVIAVMEILSTHAENEHYLTDDNQNYIYDADAAKVHAKFVQDLQAAEKTISERNASGKSVARSAAEGGLPYQLLMPSGVNDPKTGKRVANKPGRGIPYSISI